MDISDFPDGLPFDLLRRVISEECSDTIKNLRLFYNGSLIKSGVTPKRLFKDLTNVPEIECRFKHPSQTTKIHLGRRMCRLSRTDDITVYVHKGEEVHKDKGPDNLEVNLGGTNSSAGQCIVQIHWIAETPKKPFLGGYRRKADQVLFHHATSQTLPKLSGASQTPILSRETQTYMVKHVEQETLKESSTAMPKPGFCANTTDYKVITPRAYETWDEYSKKVNRCALIIQKYVRRWLAKRRVARLRILRDEYDKFIVEKERRYLYDKSNRLSHDYNRRANPKTRYDIDRLFNSLEDWRISEVDNVYKNSDTLVSRKANMGCLLDKEVEFIKKIIQKQIELSDYGKMRREELFIEKAASTIRWTAAHNLEPVEMDTPNTLRGKSLLTLFENLKSCDLNKTERMDLLLTIKKLVGKCPSPLSCDIVALTERETELMLRNIPTPILAGLRQRLLHHFVQFCKNPKHNPAVAPFLPVSDKNVSGSRAKMWNDTHRCISCGRYLRTKEFKVSARLKHLDICLFCWRQGNRGRDRLDLEPYRVILEDLRKSEAQLIHRTHYAKRAEIQGNMLTALDEAVEEQKRRRLALDYTPVDTSAIYIMEDEESLPKIESISDHVELLVTVQDVYFLVNKVWDGRSALSGCSELGNLTLCRWKVSEPWSPWNTLLLTKKEADLHMQLKDIPLMSLYAETTLTRVRQRLVIGRNAFVRLCAIGRNLTREQMKLIAKFRHPEDKNECRQMRRQPRRDDGKPLYLLSAEQRHRPTVQPPQLLIPVISGEKRMSELGITSFDELPSLRGTIKETK